MTRLSVSLALALALLFATSADAQYTNTPQVEKNTGAVITFRFSGPGLNDALVPITVPLDPSLTPAQAFEKLREDIGKQLEILNRRNLAANVPQLQPGQTVTGIAPSAQSAAEVAATAWAQKVIDLEAALARQKRLVDSGVTAAASGALSTAITALGAQITNLRTSIVADYNAADAATRSVMQGKL